MYGTISRYFLMVFNMQQQKKLKTKKKRINLYVIWNGREKLVEFWWFWWKFRRDTKTHEINDWKFILQMDFRNIFYDLFRSDYLNPSTHPAASIIQRASMMLLLGQVIKKRMINPLRIGMKRWTKSFPKSRANE